MPPFRLLFHTVKHLKAQQIFYRVFYRFRKLRVHQPESIFRRDLPPITNWPAYKKSSTRDGENFTFLNSTENLSAGWNNHNFTKLWNYKLHYLDDLTAIGACSQVDVLHNLVSRWIRENPAPKGIGWEPYPLSLRVVNLVKYLSSLTREKPYEFTQSLALQAEALRKQKERHLLGNHYFANGKALVFVGTFFEGQAAKKWLEEGLSILDSQVEEQFLSDGAHFELSPMYHCVLLWDLLDLIKLSRWSKLQALRIREEILIRVLKQGVQWLRAMNHPDGEISFFNDAALNEAPKLADIESYVNDLGIEVTPIETIEDLTSWHVEHLSSSGYISVTDMFNGQRAIVDVAQVGPDYLPGHGHADTLSFELSLFGQRVLVNSGTSHYETSTRLFERSTAAHNTVEVDGCSSSEVWDSFKVARRARPQVISLNKRSNNLELHASHSGYLRLPGKVTHHRIWNFNTKSIVIEDRLEGRWQNAVARFYCHPFIKVDFVKGHFVVLILETGEKVNIEFTGVRDVCIVDSVWNKEFGESHPNVCVQASFNDSVMRTSITW